MDSLSQFALGAAVGSAVLGRQLGWKATLTGGLLATLPDLDVLIPMGGDVADFTYHRSFSHSLLVLGLLTPLLAWLVGKLDPPLAEHPRGLRWLVLLVLLTHPLLDAMTIYGTQLLWPLDTTPIGLGSIFIIDPLYTLPLLLGTLGFIRYRHRPHLGQRLNAAGLILSTLYLGWSAVTQQRVEQQVQQQLAEQHRDYQQLLVQPTPFNTLLWRVLVMSEDGYREGFISLFDRHKSLQLQHHANQTELLDGLQQHWPVRRLQWFSKGFYRVERRDQHVIIRDLRMGLEPNYVFSFVVAQIDPQGQLHPQPDQKLASQYPAERLPELWQRIWNPTPAHSSFNAR